MRIHDRWTVAFCVVLLALLLGVPACRTGIPPLGPPAPVEPGPPIKGTFTFEIGDQLEVSVWREPELQSTEQVLPDGTITPPLLDPVPVAGKSISEVRATLQEAYTPYVNDPKVTVRVKDIEALRVFVLGEVGTPSVIPMRGRMKVLQAIAAAGGFNEIDADRSTIRIVRAGPDGCPQVYTANANMVLAGCWQDPYLAPGDVIYVHPTGLANWSRKLVQALAPFNAVLAPVGRFAGTWVAVEALVN